MATLFHQPYLLTNLSESSLPTTGPDLGSATVSSVLQTDSAYPPLRPLSIPFPEPVPGRQSVVSPAIQSSTSSTNLTIGRSSSVRQNSTAKPWLHRSSHPNFLPPVTQAPPPLSLLNDTLDLVREYREFVENVAKVQAEYGRNLALTIKKLESRLSQSQTGMPGEKTQSTSTLQASLSGHLHHLSTVANLHAKHAAAMTSQIAEPLATVEKRETEVLKKMGTWGKEVCGRWEGGSAAIEKARDKYHAAHAAYQTASLKLRSLPPPTSPHLPPPPSSNGPQPPPYPPTKSQIEYAKAQRAVDDCERIERERKNAYLIALDGQGRSGGGGQSRREGGGPTGWGEESRALHGHLHATLLESFLHHATMDVSHLTLQASIIERAKDGYQSVSITKDQDDFLDSLRVGPWPVDEGYDSENDQSTIVGDSLSPVGDDRQVRSRRQSTLHRLKSSINHPDSVSPSTSLSRSQSNGTISLARSFSSHPQGPLDISYQNFVPPPDSSVSSPTIERDRHSDTNWLRNRWVRARHQLEGISGSGDDGGLLLIKRRELETLKNLCSSYMNNRGLGDPDELWERRVGLQRELGVLERKAAAAQAEMECIESVLGPDIAPETIHDFKEKLFPTPVICDVCQQKVWSAFVPEKSCRLCSIAIHAKCELNVFVECQGPSGRRRNTRSGGVRDHMCRSLTGRNLLRRSSKYYEPHGPAQLYVEAGTAGAVAEEPLRETESHISPFIGVIGTDRAAVLNVLNGIDQMTPPDDQPKYAELDERVSDADYGSSGPAYESSPSQSHSERNSQDGSRDRSSVDGDGLRVGRIKYDFVAEADYELSVEKGTLVLVLEPDLEGCGWVRVREGVKDGMQEGLVPASYVSDGQGGAPSVDGGSGNFVIALFDYSNPALPEHASIHQHHLYELSVIGSSYDEYWTELIVEITSGQRKRGIVPTTYVMPCW